MTLLDSLLKLLTNTSLTTYRALPPITLFKRCNRCSHQISPLVTLLWSVPPSLPTPFDGKCRQRSTPSTRKTLHRHFPKTIWEKHREIMCKEGHSSSSPPPLFYWGGDGNEYLPRNGTLCSLYAVGGVVNPKPYISWNKFLPRTGMLCSLYAIVGVVNPGKSAQNPVLERHATGAQGLKIAHHRVAILHVRPSTCDKLQLRQVEQASRFPLGILDAYERQE